jgi:hypothetical protein
MKFKRDMYGGGGGGGEGGGTGGPGGETGGGRGGVPQQLEGSEIRRGEVLKKKKLAQKADYAHE